MSCQRSVDSEDMFINIPNPNSRPATLINESATFVASSVRGKKKKETTFSPAIGFYGRRLFTTKSADLIIRFRVLGSGVLYGSSCFISSPRCCVFQERRRVSIFNSSSFTSERQSFALTRQIFPPLKWSNEAGNRRHEIKNQLSWRENNSEMETVAGEKFLFRWWKTFCALIKIETGQIVFQYNCTKVWLWSSSVIEKTKAQQSNWPGI